MIKNTIFLSVFILLLTACGNQNNTPSNSRLDGLLAQVVERPVPIFIPAAVCKGGAECQDPVELATRLCGELGFDEYAGHHTRASFPIATPNGITLSITISCIKKHK